MVKVYFPLLETELELDSHATVSDACEQAGVPINLVCGGHGICNKCRVDIRERGQAMNVLSCSYPVSDGMEVFVSRETTRHQLLETALEEQIPFGPFVRLFTLSFDDLKTPKGGFYFGAIADLVGNVELAVPPYDAVVKINAVCRDEDHEKLNVVVAGEDIVDLVPGDGDMVVYGVAFDIGTTSVVGILYDLRTGEIRGRHSALNGQIKYGDDVISRIDYCNQDPGNRERETAAIHATVNDILDKLVDDQGVRHQDIYEAVYCGNSTMQHLFLGLNPEALGESPFSGTIAQAVRIPAEKFDIDINPQGTHIFMPLLGGFVGADTTACLLTLPRDGKKRMMIDLGTNGEIAIETPDGIYVASAACGPALEGAGLSGGMRGTEGAIEKFSYERGTFQFQVIGGKDPAGYCGSGIVDIIATLLKVGILSKEGRFITGEELEVHPLRERMRTDEEGVRSFVLVDASENPLGKTISVTQRDVRAVQLAKSAIYTGYVLLAAACGVKGSDLEEIALAGAFGNYIDTANAQYIGLIPCIEGVDVASVGNAAGMGAQRYLLSRDERAVAERIREAAIHVELASNPNFQTLFMRNMDFRDHLEF